ncbi:putative monooxygenase [Moniliophthora roreri MCA 2997]|uniref:Monooxygenase n=1 Tax=Moniliophthora roreri (strain MCA 2997) TaxID=1381753 RepID=V2YEE2_MONRO|nr:putative monooxygenase [Moniliophthora roreri MCA 2997]
MTSNADVLIVGAGPAGLALALLLLKNGISVRIIEKGNSLSVGQRGATIHPRTLELYKILGILPEVEKRMVHTPDLKIFTSPEGDGPIKEVGILPFMEEQPQYHRINSYQFGQDTHQGLLRDEIAKYGCLVEFNTPLESFEAHSNSVTACISGETATFNWLVGADGARSTVRKQLGLPFHGQSHAPSLACGDIEVKGMANDLWYIWGDTSHKMLSLRSFQVDGRQLGFFMMGGAKVDTVRAAESRDNLVETLYDIIGQRSIEFGDLIACGVWKANVRMIDKFGEGRVFLVGGKCPTGGQGMNAAVQDSFNLAWKLALVHKGASPPNLLQSYSTERVPVIAAILDMSTEIMRRNFAQDKKVESSNWSRGFEVRQLGVNYRNSTIVVDQVTPTSKDENADPFRAGLDGRTRGGDRAPEAPNLIDPEGRVWSVYDFLDVTTHTILFFTPGSTFVTGYPPHFVKHWLIYPQGSSLDGDERAVVDRDGYAYKHYQVQQGETRIVIIRPDGYIGALLETEEDIPFYFRYIFSS